MDLGLLPDIGGASLDLYAIVRDPGKMHEEIHLVNVGLLHMCEPIKEITKLLHPHIHVWDKIFAGRPGRRIRDVSGNRPHAVSGGITQSLFGD